MCQSSGVLCFKNTELLPCLFVLAPASPAYAPCCWWYTWGTVRDLRVSGQDSWASLAQVLGFDLDVTFQHARCLWTGFCCSAAPPHRSAASRSCLWGGQNRANWEVLTDTDYSQETIGVLWWKFLVIWFLSPPPSCNILLCIKADYATRAHIYWRCNLHQPVSLHNNLFVRFMWGPW